MLDWPVEHKSPEAVYKLPEVERTLPEEGYSSMVELVPLQPLRQPLRVLPSYYYNRNFKLVYLYMFRHIISNPPFLLQGRDGKVMVGFVVPETNELFLFDHNGYRELESGIRGNTPFDIGNLDVDAGKKISLVVGAGKYLKSYRLTKPE